MEATEFLSSDFGFKRHCETAYCYQSLYFISYHINIDNGVVNEVFVTYLS